MEAVAVEQAAVVGDQIEVPGDPAAVRRPRSMTGSAILVAADSLRAHPAAPYSRQVVRSIRAGIWMMISELRVSWLPQPALDRAAEVLQAATPRATDARTLTATDGRVAVPLAAWAARQRLPIQVERGPFRHASPLLRRGYGFFPSPNHLRIFAIRLAMGQLYDHPGRFANGFAKPS